MHAHIGEQFFLFLFVLGSCFYVQDKKIWTEVLQFCVIEFAYFLATHMRVCAQAYRHTEAGFGNNV